MGVFEQFNVKVSGKGSQAIMFAHGYGCDQNMWRLVAPQFENDFKVILFDHIGCGQSDSSKYSSNRYNSLEAYAEDVLKIVNELELKNVIFVGHSVSAMIGVLAAIKDSSKFSELILVGPSARYINDGVYKGGFDLSDIESLMESLESNYLGWSQQMAPLIMGNDDRPELGEELSNSFCQMNPVIAKNFAKVTFLSDNREDLKKVKINSLVLQCSDDIIAPMEVGQFVHENLVKSEFVLLKATGHCPNLSAPEEVTDAIKKYLIRSTKLA